MKGLILGSLVGMYWEGIGCSPSTYGSNARTSVIRCSDLSLTADEGMAAICFDAEKRGNISRL